MPKTAQPVRVGARPVHADQVERLLRGARQPAGQASASASWCAAHGHQDALAQIAEAALARIAAIG